nr:uroplakin-3b-like protein 1 isoform X3 [Pan troglodytes]
MPMGHRIARKASWFIPDLTSQEVPVIGGSHVKSGSGRGETRAVGAWLPHLASPLCPPLPAAPEHISYVPQLSNDTLAGRLTLSTFTLEQPLGQFSSHNISDLDTIWLVVALSNATQSFTAPRTNQDIPAPANFSQRGYYLTLRANRALYQARGQLHVLRVGNDTHCQPTKIGCNHPLPGPGPYRVKFLVMNDEGPVAETKWSSDTRLQQAQALRAVPGPQSPGTVVIIAILSILLAVLLTVLLAVLIYTCPSSSPSSPAQVPPLPGSPLGPSPVSVGAVCPWLLPESIAEIWTQDSGLPALGWQSFALVAQAGV